jgi:hypothetical protein
VPVAGGTLPADGSVLCPKLVRSVPPGAQLVLDGQAIAGRTPTAIGDLPAGPHQLVVTHPDALSATVSAEVAAGEQRTVDVTLPSREGTLTLEVDPPSAVALVDGREVPLDGGVGRTEPLTAGSHEVVVRALGYHQKTLTLPVEDGLHDTVRVALEPESQAPPIVPVEPR